MRQKSYERVRFPIQKQSRNSEILYLPKKRLEKALELIGALDHDKTFRLCVCVCVFFFFARRNQYNVEKLLSVFVFKANSTIHKLTFDRCHKPAQHCDRRRAERNYARCKYEHIEHM